VKKLTYFCLAFVVAVLTAIPAVAQKGQGGGRSNRGGDVRGNERAEQVQTENRKGTIAPGVENAEAKKHKHKEKDAQPDNDKNKGKHKGEQKGKHKAKGHSK
jgi:hypothetical protein